MPERLVVWSTRGILENVPANTGIPGASTPLGTYPVYLRLKFQVMKGKNLDGVPYADPVYYINYFHGGEAVHGFYRQRYGFPQSLGCIEVPPADAQAIYQDLQIGTLVTVGAGTLTFVQPPTTPQTTTAPQPTQSQPATGTPPSTGTTGAPPAPTVSPGTGTPPTTDTSPGTTAPQGAGQPQGTDAQGSSGAQDSPDAPPAGP